MAYSNRYILAEKEEASAFTSIAYLFATGGGAGYAPIAPGTVGALEGVLLYLITLAIPIGPVDHLRVLIGLSIVTFVLGVWASNRVTNITGLKDPGIIVIDEVCGQLVALTPLIFSPSVLGVVLAFLLFRFFDILKTYPIKKLEDLPSGFGVMCDDVLAGAYAAVLVWMCAALHLI